MRTFSGLLGVVLLAPFVSAQLSDLQPGRNFPSAMNAFGGSFTEDLDMGDADNDGDLDVIVANGGNGSSQANLLYINNGGVQGGTPGTFTDESATRLAGVPLDRSRDAEFVDLEGDGDLDVYISNRGANLQGQVSRAYRNLGGLQLGATGFYVESTDAFWGTLLSVPPAAEAGVADGFGPWKDWSCDCDFADFDDDGDLDLFHSTYGPNINGLEDSRVFLNDGAGRFDELWPWADAAADIRLHSLDIDLVDLDGDFDVDVFASSRESQARVYRNNHVDDGWTTDPFTDITQTALVDTGATVVGTNNYGAEYVDGDGDGDFDVWMTSYQGFANRILRNEGDLTFTKTAAWIRADTASDDNEADFLDYDGDGDIDAFVSGFSPGTNQLYQSGVAQGLDEADGYYHRNGTSSGGSQASWPEVPTNASSNTSLDGAAADMDGDGDPDVLMGNDANQQNRYWQNALGVPDTHAPTFEAVTVQGDKSDGSDTVVHAAVRDNATYYVVDRFRAELVYSVDGGDETCVRMTGMGSQLFRGVIPGAASGAVDYRVEVTDDAGNTGVSSTTSYTQTSSSISPWQNLGCGTPGVDGVPYFEGRGDLTAGSTTTFVLLDAAPGATAGLFLSIASTPSPFKGGTLYTIPVLFLVTLPVDSGGSLAFQLAWPAGLTMGDEIFWQYGIVDATALGGIALSNAAVSTQP